MRKSWIIIVVTLLVAGGLIYVSSGGSRGEMTQKVFGNEEVLDAFADSHEVTAQRLYRRHGGPTGAGELSYYSRGPSVAVPDTQARAIQRLLQRPSSYYHGGLAKSCVLDYGVVFNFRSRQRTVQVALCFNCNELGVFDGEGDNAKQISGAEDFDPIRKELVEIVRPIFPQDPDIQALK